MSVTGDSTGDEFDVRIARNSAVEWNDSTVGNPLPLEPGSVNGGNQRLSVLGQTTSVVPTTLLWGVQPATGQIIVLDPVGGSIVNQFAAPDALAPEHTQIGLTMADAGHTLVYVNADLDPTTIYRLDPGTGEVLSTETVTAGSYDGLGVVGDDLFLSNRDTDMRRQAGFSGTVDENWTTVAPVGAIGGDDFDRLFGFFADGQIHEFDPSAGGAAFLSSITAPAADVEGLAFDSETLYASTASGLLYRIDPNSTAGLGTIVAAHSGKCLDVQGGSTDDGAEVIQWACDGNAGQSFELRPVADAQQFFQIVAQHSGKCLDASGAPIGEGSDLIQTTCHDSVSQRFAAGPAGGDTFQIADTNGNCLDVFGASTDDGANVFLWPCHDGDNQKWQINAAAGDSVPTSFVVPGGALFGLAAASTLGTWFLWPRRRGRAERHHSGGSIGRWFLQSRVQREYPGLKRHEYLGNDSARDNSWHGQQHARCLRVHGRYGEYSGNLRYRLH